MSKAADELARTFNRRLTEAATGTFDATVVEVDEQQRTCTVRVGNIRYRNVALYARQRPETKGFCFIPRKESPVIVSRIGGSNMLYVSLFSEVEKVLLTIGEETALGLTEEDLEIQIGEKTFLSADTERVTVQIGEKTFIDLTEEWASLAVRDRMKVVVEEDRTVVEADGRTVTTVEPGSIELQAGSSRVRVEEDGITVEQGALNLKDILQKLCTALMTLSVSTPVGPSGPPVHPAPFPQAYANLEALLK